MNSSSQIIATIGPASSAPDILESLFKKQVDLTRLNFSWGTYEEHKQCIGNIRMAASKVGRSIPVIQDLPGPRIQEGREHHIGSGDALTAEDLKHLDFGVSMDIEWVAVSFVADAEDILRTKAEISKRGGNARVIAKIERKEAIQNIKEIINTADAIMVARGDLGQELPIEQLPFAQKEIIRLANEAKKPVIVATEMLLSMVNNSRPTRAEVTDVANAILDGADAVMLSEETATGKYPIEAVSVMEKIICEAEKRVRPAAVRNFL